MINISWGTKIAILYCSFVAMILSLVVATTFKKTDLVADDYYQQEIVFQKKLDAANAGVALKDPLQIHTSQQAVELSFPADFAGKNITGNIHFYAPADAAADRKIPINTASGSLSIECGKLAKALYEVQVSYTVSGKDYYQSLPLNLQLQ